MENNKKNNLIFYIEKDKGLFYVNDHEEPFVVQFPKDIVNNLEIVDSTKLQQLLVHFIADKEIKPTSILIVLGPDIIFEKQFENMALSLQHIEEEKFLDLVPFHRILTKTFRMQNKAHIVATNRDLVEQVASVFQEESFLVVGVVVLSSLQKKLPEIKESADLPHILKKIDTFKNCNLLVNLQQQERIISYKVPSLKNPQFIALISVFVLLIAILGFQVYTQLLSQKPVAPKTIEKVVSGITPVPIVTSPTPSSTPDEK